MVEFVQYGSGPRGLQSIIRLAKARAFVAGRFHVSIADIKIVAIPAFRHRILINYEGEAEGVELIIFYWNYWKSETRGVCLMVEELFPNQLSKRLGDYRLRQSLVDWAIIKERIGLKRQVLH